MGTEPSFCSIFIVGVPFHRQYAGNSQVFSEAARQLAKMMERQSTSSVNVFFTTIT